MLFVLTQNWILRAKTSTKLSSLKLGYALGRSSTSTTRRTTQSKSFNKSCNKSFKLALLALLLLLALAPTRTSKSSSSKRKFWLNCFSLIRGYIKLRLEYDVSPLTTPGGESELTALAQAIALVLSQGPGRNGAGRERPKRGILLWG